MKQQENEPSISVTKIFLSIIIFFYINYSILFFLDNFIIQVTIFTISAFLLIVGIYRFLPIYVYVLKADELIIIRKFSERYFDDYSIKLDAIIGLREKSKMSFKFWNNFYNSNRVNRIYEVVTNEITLSFDPDENFIEALEEKIKEH
ncbi:MAG TPA: hypothetical protein VJ962_11945 [Clostridia bacterium]|nr:hypothetical protein [Clostridia bacterium]